MGNIIRAEVSEKNPYWIEKHRHYELKHFCLQYPIWKKAYSSLNGMLSRREALIAFAIVRKDKGGIYICDKQFRYQKIQNL